VASTAAQVRLLTGLTTTELPEGDIVTFLDLNGDAPKLAAADALEAFAGTLATISVTSDDITLDGSKRATVLMQRAARLREQHHAAVGEDVFFFDVVDGGCRPELTERGYC
jgi:hypothetical protein